jgi:hypothetical protein
MFGKGTCYAEEKSAKDPSTCFLSSWGLEATCLEVNEIRAGTFATSDRNDDGRLDIRELDGFLRARGAQPTETELISMMGGLGDDSSSISFKSFLALMASELDSAPEDYETNEALFWSGFTCHVGETVPCPGSDEMCSGNMCCSGVKESRNLPFPCPSAESTFCNCPSKDKLQHCIGTGNPYGIQQQLGAGDYPSGYDYLDDIDAW